MREIILDTETTGLSPKEGDRVVEIGCVELVNRYASGRVFHCYLNPDRTVPKAAFDVHGLSDEFLADKPRFADIADEFIDFIGDARLVIHNAGFDLAFLNHELGLVRRPLISWTNVVDTLQIARQKHPGAGNSLDALCRRYGIDNSSRDKHGALLDSELLMEVYLRLVGEAQSGLDFSIGGRGDERGRRVVATLPPRARQLAPRLSDEEQQAHRAFIETLGPDALWKKFTS